MHAKQRIELIIERMAFRRACRLLQEAGMTGYTVFPAIAGSGKGNYWDAETDMSDTNEMVMIISIGDAERVAMALEQIGKLLGKHIGVVSVTDVKVLRPERF